MNAILSVDWDALFGYVVHDYCMMSIFCAAALTALAVAVRLNTQRSA